ncbi:uncharacterized protein [Watersipora subatra]|uniref:uncharacterized protein n=1 Tax=Watersipora subatra TaxID=2589382 RepID=UPI00355C0E2C
MKINASGITPEMLGLPESTDIGTYYFRMRTHDSNYNYANWSNPVSASYVKPETIIAFFEQMPTEPPTSTEPYTTTTETTTEEQTTRTHAISTSDNIISKETTTYTVTQEADETISMLTVIVLGVALCTIGVVTVLIGLGLVIYARRTGYMNLKRRDWSCGEDVVGKVYYSKYFENKDDLSYRDADEEKGLYKDEPKSEYSKLCSNVSDVVAEVSEQTHL